MSAQEPSAPAPPPSSIAPAQERAPSPSNSLGDAPITNPPSVRKTGSKKKGSKRRASKRAKAAEPVEPPAPLDRYEPYRRAEPTPEREAALPADPEELETLDATAKQLFKSDREVREYVESLKLRTAAMLEHVKRTSSQLRACKGSMGRIGLFMAQRQTVDGKVEGSDESSDEEDNAPYVERTLSLLYTPDLTLNRDHSPL